MRRGQITVFIIIGVLMISLIVFFLFNSSKQQLDDEEVIYIKFAFEECIGDRVLIVLEEFGKNPDLDGSEYAILFEEGKISQTQIHSFEENIKRALLNEMDGCLVLIRDDNNNYIIDSLYGKKIDLFFSDERVTFGVEYPIKISRDQKSYVIRNYRDVEVFLRLKDMLDLTNKILIKQVERPDSICISCLMDFSEEYNLDIEIDSLDEGMIFITLRDEESKLNEDFYELKFAIEV